MSELPTLTAGFHPVPAGHVALIVTYLEMTTPPDLPPLAPREDLTLKHIQQPDAATYAKLFAEVGAAWLWFSRSIIDLDTLQAMITAPGVEIYELHRDGKAIGLLELDFGTPGEVYLAFFGLTADAIGTGAGRFLMDNALRLAWRKGVRRMHLNTCNADHPSALGFYRRTGFVPYKRAVEINPDQRLNGVLPRDVAPHIPVIE